MCPTEIISFSEASDKFAEVNAQVIGVSTDTEETHLAWIRTSRKRGGLGHMKIPLVADVSKDISAMYGTLSYDVGIAFRGTYLINPEGVLEAMSMNNFPVGRSVDEQLRLIQAFQFVAEHGEVCPVGWKPGDKTMIPTTDGSVEYFASGATEQLGADESAAEEDDFASFMPTMQTPQELESAIKGNKMVSLSLPHAVRAMSRCTYVPEGTNERAVLHALTPLRWLSSIWLATVESAGNSRHTSRL